LSSSITRSLTPLQRHRCAACGFEAKHYLWRCPRRLTWDSDSPQRLDAG
jgi:lipopolysaccharide biosynthesis regulator YciM